MNNMKKTYISPETVVFVCKTNSLLMASQLNEVLDDIAVTPTEEEYEGEFSVRDLDFDEEEDLDY